MRLRSYLILLVFFIVLVAAALKSLQRCGVPMQTVGPAQDDVASLASSRGAAAGKESPAPGASKIGVQSNPPRSAQQTVALPPATAQNIAGIEGLSPRLSRPLMFDVPGVQGLAATASDFYLTAFDARQQTATLYRVRRADHTMAQLRHLQQGPFVLPGSVQRAERWLWVPLMASRAEGGSLILGIDPQYLEVKQSFIVPQRIAVVAETRPGRVVGLTEGSSEFVEWAPGGQALRAVPCASGAIYHDVEVIGNSLVLVGTDTQGGVIDIFDPTSLTLLARRRANARGPSQSWVTAGGFAFAGGEFFFLPNEGPRPVLTTFVLSGMPIDRYIPSVQP